MATYNGLLHDWKQQSASHPINTMAYTPAGILSMQTTGAGYAKDCEKLNEAMLLGWRVLRVTSDQVFDGRAVRWIQRAMGHNNNEGV